MVGSLQGQLIHTLSTLRQDLQTIIRAAIDGASAARAVTRACADSDLAARIRARPRHVIAAGKAAGAMTEALWAQRGLTFRSAMCVSTNRSVNLPPAVEWYEAAHPVPDERSVVAGKRALEIAANVADDELLILLLSGGGSALLAVPIDGLTLADKQHAVTLLLRHGADIHALNTVRKHLSAIKGGRLAARCKGETLTLAVSDVVGDELGVIASGPGVADPTTWRDAADCLSRAGIADPKLRPVQDVIARGVAGALPDTPKPADPSMSRAEGRVIASRIDALNAARAAAHRLGYAVVVLSQPVVGESRQAAADWFANATRTLSYGDGPRCFVSAGETTVRVTGRGSGGRNQEFVLALADTLATSRALTAIASVGTDGIDGPTDAAGAIVDTKTASRAAELGLAPSAYLTDNNSYAFFSALSDLIVTGPTDTNVGDIQILLTA